MGTPSRRLRKRGIVDASTFEGAYFPQTAGISKIAFNLNMCQFPLEQVFIPTFKDQIAISCLSTTSHFLLDSIGAVNDPYKSLHVIYK